MKQSFYIFLCALLGMMLFLLIQRSLFLIGYLVFGVAILDASFIFWDRWTFVFALFFGMWYGIWIGLHWHRVIYQDRVEPGVMSRVRTWLSPQPSEGSTWNLQELITSKAKDYGGGIEIFERDIAVRAPLSAHVAPRRTVRTAATKKVVTSRVKKAAPKK